jgi:hypothetical protein
MKSAEALKHFNRLMDDLTDRRGSIFRVSELWVILTAKGSTWSTWESFYPDIVKIYNRIHGATEVELN